MAKVKTKFKINRRGVRESILLDSTQTGVETALLAMADDVKPPGTETFVARSYGPAGRFVIWIMDQSPNDGPNARTRATQRRWKKAALQQVLNRIGGRFRKGGGRKFEKGDW